MAQGRRALAAARHGLGIAARVGREKLGMAMRHAERGARVAGHHSRNGLQIARVHGGRSALAIRDASVRMWNYITSDSDRAVRVLVSSLRIPPDPPCLV